MKVKVSISIEDTTLEQIQGAVQGSIFRNQSHFIEAAAKKYLKEVKDGRFKNL